MGIRSHTVRSKIHAHTMKRVAQTFAPYKFQALLVVLLILLLVVLDLIKVLMIKRIFDDGIEKRNVTWLLVDAGIMAAIPLVSGVIEIWKNSLNGTLGQNVMRNLRNRLYQHVQSLSLRFFTATQAGEIQSRLSNDINAIQGEVTNMAARTVYCLAEVLSAVIAMFVLSPVLTAALLGLLPICFWLTTKEGKLGRTVSRETQQSLARLSAMMQETLSVSGILLLKIFGRQAYAQKLFELENQRLTDLKVHQQKIGRWLFMLMNAFFWSIYPIIYVIAGWQMISDSSPSLTIGTIAAFTGLQWKLFAPTQTLLSMQVEIQGTLASFDRIFEYLDLPVEITDAPHAISLVPEKTQGRLTFEDVTFTYKRDVPDAGNNLGKNGTPDLASENSSGSATEQPSDWGDPLEGRTPRPALKNVSFEILPGQMVALVGPSGAGKTTTSYLAARLYDVESGSVKIDGHHVKDVTLASLSQVIGMVTQETYLLHASVRENLLFARLDATEEEMITAAKAAAIHDRILELDDGYDTIVGERGYRLSGGEKQRLAIARVILKNPRILILDEATSALDTHSERLIQTALKPLMKGRTTLVIAHRLSTILTADVILVLHQGEIVERGTHQQLLALGGFYARLYHEQFG